MKRPLSIIERLIVATVVAIFIAPLPMTVLLFCFPRLLANVPALRNGTLQGARTEDAHPVLTWNNLRSGNFQRNFANKFDQSFVGREWVIRLTCEAWYRLFNGSPFISDPVTLGRDNFIFENFYLEEYCVTRTPRDSLAPVVRDIKRLQDICQARGMAFVFLITPSKAAILPEKVPDAWLKRYDPRPRGYVNFLSLLQGSGIHFIDGHALTVQAMKESGVPVFPKGGTHWDPYAAWKANNAVLAALRAQGKPVEPLEYEPPMVSDRPEGEEADLLDHMNLMRSWRYPSLVMQIKPRQSAQPPKLKMAIIGGSFTYKTARQLSASGQFDVDQFYYYRVNRLTYTDNGRRVVTQPVDLADFDKEIFAADCLVLETNESLMNEGKMDFVVEALKRLEK